MAEIWKDIEGYEGLYQVSNLGRVKRVSANRILSPAKNFGYNKVGLSKDGIVSQYRVHRLVADAFIPKDDSRPFINHIDGVRDNNRLENLERCTQSENMKHAYQIGNKTPIRMIGKDNPKSNLILDKSNGVFYYSVVEAANSINIKPTTLRAMLRGENKNKTHFITV